MAIIKPLGEGSTIEPWTSNRTTYADQMRRDTERALDHEKQFSLDTYQPEEIMNKQEREHWKTEIIHDDKILNYFYPDNIVDELFEETAKDRLSDTIVNLKKYPINNNKDVSKRTALAYDKARLVDEETEWKIFRRLIQPESPKNKENSYLDIYLRIHLAKKLNDVLQTKLEDYKDLDAVNVIPTSATDKIRSNTDFIVEFSNKWSVVKRIWITWREKQFVGWLNDYQLTEFKNASTYEKERFRGRYLDTLNLNLQWKEEKLSLVDVLTNEETLDEIVEKIKIVWKRTEKKKTEEKDIQTWDAIKKDIKKASS